MTVTPILRAVVARAARHAILVVVASLALATAGALYARGHLGVTTNTDDLFSNKLAWKQREMRFDRLFPQFNDLLVAVVDARVPEEANATAAALAARLEADPAHIRTVRRPDDLPFFTTEGLLFLDTKTLTGFLNQLIDAQPFLGQLNADPSARGLLSALSLVALGVQHGQSLQSFQVPLRGFEAALGAVAAGHARPLSWQDLLGGSLAAKAGRFRFVLVQPKLDYSSIAPGGGATAAIRQAAAVLPFVRSGDARVRITGSVALSDEEFASVAKGALKGLIGSFLLVLLWLFLALQSWRLIVPVAATLVLGLVLTTTFAAIAVGTLNLISVAFAILFVGIAVDFAIQFTVRLREFSIGSSSTAEALDRTVAHVGRQIGIASIATACGFLAFTPTAFIGVAGLGLIAGGGMLIAFVCTITFLPAAIVLCRPRAGKREVGFRQLKRADIAIGMFRLPIVLGCLLLLFLGAVATNRLRFDADPLHTKNPHTESMETLADLVRNPLTTPYTANALVPNGPDADALQSRLASLPTVADARSLNSFVPADQPAKLALIADAASLLGPTLDAPSNATPPTAADIRMAVRSTLGQIERVAPTLRPGDPLLGIARRPRAPVGRVRRDARGARRLAHAFPAGRARVAPRRAWRQASDRRDASRGAQTRLDRARRRLARGGDRACRGLRQAGRPRTVRAAGGGGRPAGRRIGDHHRRHHAHHPQRVPARGALRDRGDRGDPAGVDAPPGRRRRHPGLAADVGGGDGDGQRAPAAAAQLRQHHRAAAAASASACRSTSTFVMNWRAGESSRLASPTARAVIFSALTTGTAFGSLALSEHPGTASMGKLLLISLGGTLFGSLVFIPALLAMLSRSRLKLVGARYRRPRRDGAFAMTRGGARSRP